MAERRGLAQLVNFPRVTGSFRAIPAVASDPDFASVVLLLDFAGADEATDITDLSDSGHVDTFVGGAAIDTAEQFLGENSVLFANASDNLNFPNNADFDFGTGDFTVEFGVRWTASIGGDALISKSDPATANGWYIFSTATTLRLTVNDIILSEQTHSMVADTFFHVAVTRTGTDLRIFVDGVQIGSTVTDSTAVDGNTGVLHLGVLLAGVTPLGGALGAVRITKGVGRYTANFTPLTEFYPTS